MVFYEQQYYKEDTTSGQINGDVQQKRTIIGNWEKKA